MLFLKLVYYSCICFLIFVNALLRSPLNKQEKYESCSFSHLYRIFRTLDNMFARLMSVKLRHVWTFFTLCYVKLFQTKHAYTVQSKRFRIHAKRLILGTSFYNKIKIINLCSSHTTYKEDLQCCTKHWSISHCTIILRVEELYIEPSQPSFKGVLVF